MTKRNYPRDIIVSNLFTQSIRVIKQLLINWIKFIEFKLVRNFLFRRQETNLERAKSNFTTFSERWRSQKSGRPIRRHIYLLVMRQTISINKHLPSQIKKLQCFARKVQIHFKIVNAFNCLLQNCERAPNIFALKRLDQLLYKPVSSST